MAATTNDKAKVSPTSPAAKRVRGRRRAWFSLATIVLVVTVALIARTRWVARELSQLLQTKVKQETGLDLQLARVGFSWSHLAVRAEGVSLTHPAYGQLAAIDVLEVRPAFTSLFRRQLRISSVSVDGGSVELHFRHGQLVNGPISHPQGPQRREPELPFRDLAISDVRIHVDDDALGVLDLPSVDVDLRNAGGRRILLGVLAHGGRIANAQCFNGPIPTIEARGELRDWRTLTIALARIELGGISAHVREAVIPLSLDPPGIAGMVRADAEISGPIPAFTCPIPFPPNSPRPHGFIDVSVNGAFDPATIRFQANGHIHASNTSIEMPWSDAIGRFGLGDDTDIRFTASQEEIRVDSLLMHHSGGTIASPGAQPAHPVRIHIADLQHPTIEGHVDVIGAQLQRLVHELSVTEFAKVLWTVNASADLHGELWRFGEPADPHHPAIWFDIAAETRDFAVLRDFWMRTPQYAVLSLARGSVTGQIAIDSSTVRFKHLIGLFGPNNRSRVDVDLIQLRMNHDPHLPDLVVDNAHGENVNLADVGHIAEFPIAGEAAFLAHGSGRFNDPIITGTAHLRNFRYNGLPLGDYDTRAGNEWHFRNMRVDMPIVDARAGRSTFVARNAYLDFGHYTLMSSAHITSDNFYIRDYYHMFKFENDPTFEQYSGQTMPRCPTTAREIAARSRTDVPCVDPHDPYERDERRLRVPAGTQTGHLEADASFVLGRPGDDAGGVMDVELWARNMYVIGFGEPVSNFDAHYKYSWLVRDLGYRGSRQNIEYARGRWAGGMLEASGNVDFGGEMHFVGNVRNVSLGSTVMAGPSGALGTLNGSGTLEGQPDAQRWNLDADVHSLTVASRNVGDFSMHVHSRPDGPRSNDPNARPPRNLWSIDASALGDALHVRGSMTVPWRLTSWRDIDNNNHPGWDRDWMHAPMIGTIDLAHPLDMVPLVPTRMAARLGSNAHALLRGRIDLDGAMLGDLEHADARLTIHELDVLAQGMRVALAPDTTFAACVRDGTYWIDPAAANSVTPCLQVPSAMTSRTASRRMPAMPVAPILGPEGTNFTLSGGGTIDGHLNLAVDGQIDLARFATLVPTVTSARGSGQFQIHVRGDTNQPLLSGTFRLRDGSVADEMLPNPIEDIQLLVRLDGNDILFEQAVAQFAASSINLTDGRIHIHGRDVDRIDIPLRVQNLSLVPLPGAEIALDANTRLEWQPGERLPVFSGDISLSRVRYTRPINLVQDSSGQTSVAGSGGSTDAPYDPRNDHVRLSLNVHAREPIRVANNLVDGEIVIAENERPFRVLGTDQRVGVVGTLMIPRGRVILPIFRGSDFEISHGLIELNNPESIQPNFDVSAQTNVYRGSDVSRNQWRVALHGYGTPERFSLDMTSDPPLSRDDIALLLTLGATRAELEQAGGNNLMQALILQGIATGTGIDRTVRQAFPVIDDFRIGTAYSASQGRTVPQVAVGRRINENVRVGATVNTTEQREMRATVDVRVSDHASVQFGYDNMNDAGSSQFGNLGADLRWRLDFE